MGFDMIRLLANKTIDDRPVFRYYRELTQPSVKSTVVSSIRNRPLALVVGLLFCGIGVATVSAGFKKTDGVDAVQEHTAKIQAQLLAYERQLRERFS